MEDPSLLAKIDSKYILDEIFSYIRKKNFKLKFFVYSNYFQKRLDLKLINYQESYLNQFNMELLEFLQFPIGELEKEDFNRNILKEKLDDNIKKYHLDIEKIESIIVDYFRVFQENQKFEIDTLKEIPIEIYSPFLNCISKTKYFEIVFTINIVVELIEKFNLKEDYINAFKNLNNSGANYSSLKFKFIKNEDINYLKDFNVNFEKIKRLTLIEDYSSPNTDYNFLKTLFSFNLTNNLVYLKINLTWEENIIQADEIENLNCLQSLKVLSLSYFNCHDIFLLKIKGLLKLDLDNCINISLDKDIFLNLKYLFLTSCRIVLQDWILKLPCLEKLIFVKIKDENKLKLKLEKFFDLSFSYKLRYLEIESDDFISIDCPRLEEAILSSNKNTKNNEIKMLEKLITSEHLIKIDFDLSELNNDDILAIKGENDSVEKMILNWNNRKDDCLLFNLQNKFKNLNNLVLNEGNEGIKTNKYKFFHFL